MASVYIPVQNSEEEVRVALDQLPRDASDILDILKAEQAPLDLWLIIAREYFKQGKTEQFRQILEEGSSPEIDEYYADVKYERIAILNALGAYHTYLGKIETKQREKDENIKLATQYYNRASRIDVHEPSTWIGKGQLFVAKGDLQQASGFFKIVLDEDPSNIPALLGQACVEFNQGESQDQYNKSVDSYKNSLKLFKRALQVHPNCTGGVRLGIALCRYRLGQSEKARQAFQRVLQLDPENVEALVALGIMELQTNEADGIQKGMEKMQRAFEVYPYCSTALNHLANHFFFTGQHFLVEQLTETALSASNHGLTKSHSYYNLARSYHSKGDFEKAGRYYMASVKEINRPQDFVLPYYGLGQVQLKLGDFKSSLSSFEKVLDVYPENCESLKAVGNIYVQLGQNEKALEIFRKAARIDPRDAEAFMELGELLISSDAGAALDAFRTALGLLKKSGEGVPIELLNNIGVLYFEKGEFELAEQTFKEALGDGIWDSFLSGRINTSTIECSAFSVQYRDMSIFHQLEEDGTSLKLPWDKVTTLFNQARLLEQLYDTEKAHILYRLILFKYPDYIDAYLRLAAMAKARNNIQSSIALIGDALKVDDRCTNALSMLGSLELKNDDWVKAKDTFCAARDATDCKDSYATLSLGNWNYFAALRSEKRGAKLLFQYQSRCLVFKHPNFKRLNAEQRPSTRHLPTMVEGTIVAICQYGGEFVTNSDGSLFYTGGEARAVDVGHDILLEEFKSEIASTFDIDISGMSIKYFLPSNKRVLITISNDKDLQRMVAYNMHAMSTEVYILNKVDNRATRSTAADSGTSIVATTLAEQSGKRKRPTSGAARATKSKLRAADSSNLNAAPIATANAINNVRLQISTVTENVDNSAHGFGAVHAGLPVFLTSAVTGDDVREQGLTAVDNFDDRENRSILVDPSTHLVHTLASCDDVRPLNLTTLWGDVITDVGQEFDNVKEFRGQLCKYAICKGFVYKFVKNESTRVTVKCNDENCPWRIHASESSQKQKFVIKKMNNVHTCGGGNGKDGQRRATRQWLTSIIKEKLQASQPCKPKEIVREIYEEYGVSLTYSQVWRGREDAQKELYSMLKETYSQLPWLCERILETNPGSVALLSASIDSKVRRFFVSFHASLHGFEKGCRPLIFLDRIPLKANTQCKLLAAAAVDGDDAIFPLAFAAVEDETYDTWLWFLSQLKFAVGTSRAITFASNRQTGLDEAVPRVFEDSYHSYCLRHLIDDFKLELKKGPWSQQVRDGMVDDFIRAAQACTIEDFNASIESIRSVSADVAEWVLRSKPENWSDAIFRGSRYDHFSSDIMDSFNNWIPVKSESSVVLIVETIRNRLMEMIQSRRDASIGWMSTLTPSMEQKLEKEMAKSKKLNVLCSSETVFEVRGNTIYVVNLGSWECTCRRWQISGLPCPHAIAVFNRINRCAYDYCSKYFTTECYHAAYSESIQPIPDVENIDFNTGANLYPPPARRPPGRPRRKRFNPNKTVTVVRLCSRCKAQGHNKATCEAFL